MKFQIKMTMTLATIYGHDTETEEGNRVCLVVAGLGAIENAGKKVENNMVQRLY